MGVVSVFLRGALDDVKAVAQAMVSLKMTRSPRIIEVEFRTDVPALEAQDEFALQSLYKESVSLFGVAEVQDEETPVS